MSASAFERLLSKADEWNVAIDETRETENSVLAFGVCQGAEVVLKVSKQTGDEWNAGEVQRSFQGAGTVRLFKSDGGVVLIERLRPGTELIELVRKGDDEQATRVFVGVLSEMRSHDSPAGCPSVLDWARGFDRYLIYHADGPIPVPLVEEAKEIYRGLATSQRVTMLLHGDLHHYNVLLDEKRGWVAIDPKGVVGELEYELGAIIRNPIELPGFYLSPEVIKKRLLTLTTMLNLDYSRALGWSFAQAVLSAIWDTEDGYEVTQKHPALRLARGIKSMLC